MGGGTQQQEKFSNIGARREATASTDHLIVKGILGHYCNWGKPRLRTRPPRLQSAPIELSSWASQAAMNNKQFLVTASVAVVRSNTSSLARRCCEDRSGRAALCDELVFRVWRRFV